MTHEVTTTNPRYEILVVLVQQLRARLLSDKALRRPLLSLFETVYHDDSESRTHPPCDDDVIDFLTNAFPHLYMELHTLTESDVGETASGRASADKEEFAINIRLISCWIGAIESPNLVSLKLYKMHRHGWY